MVRTPTPGNAGAPERAVAGGSTFGEGVGSGAPVVLALRALKLGDLLVAVPALRALRRAFPGHRLVFAAPGWLAPIVNLVGSVDELLHTPGLDGPLAWEPGTVDVAVNLHGNGPESRAALDALLPRRRIGHRSATWDGPEWLDGIHERDRWTRLLRGHGIDADPSDFRLHMPESASIAPEAAVVHVGAFYGSRQWPVERFGAVAAALRNAGHTVLLTGSASERERALAVAAAGSLSRSAVVAGSLALDEFAAVIAHAKVVVSADTGAAHLASAYGIPSVVLFGPAPPEEWGPPPGPHIVLTAASLRRGETFSAEPDPALLAVSVRNVLAALGRLGLLAG